MKCKWTRRKIENDCEEGSAKELEEFEQNTCNMICFVTELRAHNTVSVYTVNA